jgi:uncharacterized membrane protein (DUF2068 family)
VAQQSGTMLRVIGGLKIAKALMLLAAGIGVVSLGTHHIHTLAWNFHHDEGNRYINDALATVARVSPHRMHELGVGCFVYAALFGTEGIGLWMRKVWAEYMTVIITSSFIPFEVYEMVEHRSVVKAIVIALNVAIVVYLVWRLRRDKHWPFR